MADSKGMRSIVELVSVMAVVASLVFVGIQLRQDQQIAVAQIFADFDDTQIELSRLLIENEAVWIAGRRGDTLSDSEQFKFNAIAEAVIAKHTGFINRAFRVETNPVESYVTRFAMLLHTWPGLGTYYRNKCAIEKELGHTHRICGMVMLVLQEFENGTRAAPLKTAMP